MTTERAGASYLDRLMRRESFEPLWRLFANAERPAKELTESFSALEHLRPFMAGTGEHRVVHIGDGAYCRTGALFALKSSSHNISVDPHINVAKVVAWRDRFAVRRFEWRAAAIEDIIAEVNAMPRLPTFVTFVHAHVSTDDVLDALRWDAAFTLACCVPGKQLTSHLRVLEEGIDARVMGTGQRFQVLVSSKRSGDPDETELSHLLR